MFETDQQTCMAGTLSLCHIKILGDFIKSYVTFLQNTEQNLMGTKVKIRAETKKFMK